MKGQSHGGFKRPVSAPKMRSSSLWRASLVLRFKYISQILCVCFHFKFSPLIPPFHFIISPLWVSSKTVALNLSYLKPQQSLFQRGRILLETNSMIFLGLSFICYENSFLILFTYSRLRGIQSCIFTHV